MIVLILASAMAIDLTQPVLVSGQPAILTATGATPGSDVLFAVTPTQGTGICPPSLGGACLDIEGIPTIAATAVADAIGTATATVTVPECTPSTAAFQAVTELPIALSSPVTSPVAPDPSPAWPALLPQPGTDPDNPAEHDQWYFSLTPDQIDELNGWYLDGTAAGFVDDAFHSFDDDHSTIRGQYFPQLDVVTPSSYHCQLYADQWFIETNAITYGVASLTMGDDGRVWSAACPQWFYLNNWATVGSYSWMYDANFLMVQPAVYSYDGEGSLDKLSHMSPYYLLSEGNSGTDVALAKVLYYAAAALHPDLKTRMMANGTYIPTLMWLFKTHIDRTTDRPWHIGVPT